MALADVYPLSFLNDRLITKQSVTVSMKRSDEQSGSGDGRYWIAQLARPLWQVEMTLESYGRNCIPRAREIDAKIRALDGTRRSFLFADPTYSPGGGVAPGTGVTISAIASDRTTISLTGLPASYPIMAGDRLSITWGTDRVYYGEIAQSLTATSAGVLSSVPIFPYLPLGISTGASVELAKPYLKVMVPPDGYTPFSYIPGFVAQGASLTMLQRV